MAEVRHDVARRFAGWTVIVTGGASGIGAATADRLAREGANVAVADLDEERARQVAAGIADRGDTAKAYAHDVADRASWAALVQRVRDDHGGLDALVNNAGITRDRSLLRMSDAEWDAVIDVHLKGAWLGCQHAIPAMRERGRGSIVNLSSSSRRGAFGQSNYAAAKSGMIGLTRTVALEHARHGVRCNAVAPGYVRTPMTDNVPEEVRATWVPRIPLARPAEATEIAACVAFLLSEDASFVTGQLLAVDGGVT